MPASRDSDLVQPMQSRTSSTKKGRSISSKSAAAASSPSSRRPVVPSSRRPVVPCSRRTSSPKMERPTPGTPGLLAFCRTPGAKRPCLRVSRALPGVLSGRSPGVLLGFCLAARGRGQGPCRGVFGLIKQPKGQCSSPGVWGERELASRGHLPCLNCLPGSAPQSPAAAWLVLARRPAGTSAGGARGARGLKRPASTTPC